MIPELRKAEIYAEMKDINKITSILFLKKTVFEKRKFNLRMLVLKNLSELVQMQLRALDEAYNLIGLDRESLIDDEHILHDIEIKITKLREKKALKSSIQEEKRQAKNESNLQSLVEDYIDLIYQELKSIHLENLYELNRLLKKEQILISKIEKEIKDSHLQKI